MGIRGLVSCLALVALAGCGSDSPTAPTPTFINMVGGWAGTFTSNLNFPNVPGGNQSENCTVSWNITSQNGGQFSGTWQLTDGTIACASSGTLTGTIDTGGAITSFSAGTTVGPLGVAGCTRTNASPWVGRVSATSVNLSTTEQWSCAELGAGAVGRDIALTKR